MSSILQALGFLVNMVFTLYLVAIGLRFLLQWVKADFYNPVCQFLIKVTNPVLVPLRRLVPGLFGLDIAALLLMLIVQILALGILAILAQYPLTWFIVIVALVKLVLLFIHLYFFAIILRAVSSWFNPNPYHPMTQLLIKLTEPLLQPARRVIPLIGGIDLSPVAVLIILQMIAILVRGLL